MHYEFLHELFVADLQCIYNAEQQIISAMPELIDAVTTPALKEAFETHLKETEKQAQQLEDLALSLQIDLNQKRCLGIDGLISEAREKMTEMSPSPVTDLALISLAQKIEHYEIGAYGTVTNYAKKMGHEDTVKVLDTITDEEGKTDKKLTQLAEIIIEQQEKGLVQ